MLSHILQNEIPPPDGNGFMTLRINVTLTCPAAHQVSKISKMSVKTVQCFIYRVTAHTGLFGINTLFKKHIRA
jgi:hypothetical protein